MHWFNIEQWNIKGIFTWNLDYEGVQFHCNVVAGLIVSLFGVDGTLVEQLNQQENDLDAADDGKPTKEPHCAPDETQLGLSLDLLVLRDVIKGRRVKEDPHKS